MSPDGTELSPIPKMTRVFYDVYADLPVAGLVAGRDFAYATDRRTLYYWDGTAWVELSIYSYSGAAADIPAAANLLDGSLYFETDTGITKQVQAGAWVTINTPAYNYTELAGGENHLVTTASVWENWDLEGAGIIPAGAVMVEVYILNGTATALIMGARNDGSALDREDSIGKYVNCTILCPVTAGIIEIYSSSNAFGDFSIVGYWS